MPPVVLSFGVAADKAENPFRDRQLNFRRALLYTLVTFITIMEVPIGFVQFLALLPQAIYAAVVGGVWDVAYSTPIFLPWSTMAPLLPTGPNVITFFKRELTEKEMKDHNAKKVSLTGFRKMHPYLFRHVTPMALVFIEENDGQLDMKSYLGACSASAAATYFQASKWARAFLKAYHGIGESEGEAGILTVGKSRWMKRVTEFTSEDGVSGMVEEECDEEFQVPEGSTILRETFLRDRLLFVSNQEPLFRHLLDDDLPLGTNYGLFVQYIPDMYLPDPFTIPRVLGQYALPNLIRKTVNYLPKQAELASSFSELSSLQETGHLLHLYYCIDLAIRSHVNITAVIEENEYLGVILTHPTQFLLTVGGVAYPAEDGDALTETLKTSSSHLFARKEMARLLSTIDLYDEEDTNLPMNKKEVTARDLVGTADLAYALFCRREQFSDDEEEQIKVLFGQMTFPPPTYFPLTSDFLSRVFHLCGRDQVWGIKAGVTDIFLEKTSLFDFDVFSFNIRAFGKTFVDLRRIGGTKFLIHTPKGHHFISAKRNIPGKPTKQKKNATLVETFAHNRLVLPRTGWRDARDHLEMSFREGYVMVQSDDKAPTPGGAFIENTREDFTKVWDALVVGCRKYRKEKGYTEKESGDEKSDREEGSSRKKGKGEPPEKKRKLLLDEESDDEMD